MRTKENSLLPIYITLWIVFSLSILFYHKDIIFPSFCADGQTRAVLGAKWIHAPFFMNAEYSRNSIWMPLQYWIIGLGLKIFYDLYWAPIAINLLFSAGSLWMLYKISWMFYENRIVSFISVILAGFIPWFVWLSISGMGEPLAIFLIITSMFFYFSWLKDIAKIRFLALSSLAQVLGNMTRYENLAFSFFLTISAIVVVMRNKNIFKTTKVRMGIFFILICPWIFPLAWHIAQYFNDRVLFSAYYACKKEADFFNYLSFKGRVLKFVNLGTVAPVILFFALIEFFRSAHKKIYSHIAYYGAVIFYNISLFALFLGNAIPLISERTNVISFLLLSPFAAKFIYDIFIWFRFSFFMRSLLVIIFSSFIAYNAYLAYFYPLDGGVATFGPIGQKLKTLWQQGVLSENDLIMIKPKDGHEILSYNVVAAYSNHPFNIYVSEARDPKVAVVHSQFSVNYADKIAHGKEIYRWADYSIILLK